MPQLVFTDWAPQLIWLAICFIGLYLLMSSIALPRIGQVIEERRDRIQRDLDEAERLKNETEEAIASYEQALAEARGKAHGIAQTMRDTLNAEVEAERSELDAKLAEHMAEADARIAAATASAMSHIAEIATDTAGAIVEQLIGTKVDHAKVTEAVSATSGTK